MQMALVSMLSSLLIIAVFGPMMPALLLAAPFYMWCNLCSLRWIQRNSTMPFGQVLAATVLIQKPVSIFEVMALSLTWIVSVCVCFDVQFSTIHIIVLSCVFMLVQVPASIILKAHDNLPKDEGTDDVSLEIGDSKHASLSPTGMKHDLDAADLDEMEAQNVTIERQNSNYFSRSSKKDFLTDLKSVNGNIFGDVTVMENPVAVVARSPRSSATKPNTSPKNKQKRATTWFRGQAADRGVDPTEASHRNDRDNSSNATDMVAVSPRAPAASRVKRHTKLDTPLAKLKKLKDSAKHRDQEWHAIQQRHATERNELKDSTASRADRASSAAHPQSLKKAHASESSTNHHAQTQRKERTPSPRTPRSPRKLKQSVPESPKRSQSPRKSKKPLPTTPKRTRSPRKSKQHKSPNDETLAL